MFSVGGDIGYIDLFDGDLLFLQVFHHLTKQGADTSALFSQVVKYLEKEQIPIKEVNVTDIAANGKHSKASFVVSVQNIFGWDQIKAALQGLIDNGIEFDSELAALSLIGEGMNRDNQTLLEAIDLLAQNAIPVCGVTTTSFRISLLLPREQVDKSVQLCHAHWIA